MIEKMENEKCPYCGGKLMPVYHNYNNLTCHNCGRTYLRCDTLHDAEYFYIRNFEK